MGWLHHPAVAWLVPVPLLLALAPLLWRVFRADWLELDRAAARERAARPAGTTELRPMVAAVPGVHVLALQEHFGRHAFFGSALRPALAAVERANPGGPLDLATWGDLYAHAWWGFVRVGGYLLMDLLALEHRGALPVRLATCGRTGDYTSGHGGRRVRSGAPSSFIPRRLGQARPLQEGAHRAAAPPRVPWPGAAPRVRSPWRRSRRRDRPSTRAGTAGTRC
jgi:hypothetical protein